MCFLRELLSDYVNKSLQMTEKVMKNAGALAEVRVLGKESSYEVMCAWLCLSNLSFHLMMQWLRFTSLNKIKTKRRDEGKRKMCKTSCHLCSIFAAGPGQWVMHHKCLVNSPTLPSGLAKAMKLSGVPGLTKKALENKH